MKNKSHKTAIKRIKPSLPARNIVSFLINKVESIFDYGCGNGNDISFYKKYFKTVKGFDPYYRNIDITEIKDNSFEAVTCIYVLNVIDNVKERLKVIENIIRISKKYIIIYTRSDKEINKIANNWKIKNDGYITKTGTFQKGFNVNEIISMINKFNIDYDIIAAKNISKYTMIILKKK